MEENAPPRSRTLGEALLGYLIYLTNLTLIVMVIGLLVTGHYLLAAGVFALELIFASSRWLQTRGAQSRRGALGLFRNIRVTHDGWAFCILTVFLTVAALNHGANLLYLIFAMLYSALLVNGILGKMTTSGLVVQRFVPRAVEAGRDFTVRMVVRNRKRRMPAFAVTIEDTPFESPTHLPRRVWAAAIKPTEELTLRYTANVPQRGVARFRNVRVLSLFPFGLFEQWYYQTLDTELLVWPRMGRLLNRVTSYVAGLDEQPALKVTRSGLDEEFRSIRDYREGDNPRHIHWRTSARAGKLMVKEFEHREEKRIAIYLDTFIKNDPLEEPTIGRVELAISFAATLIREFLNRGFLVHFAMLAPELVVMNDLADRAQLVHVLRHLALAQPNREHDVNDLFEATEGRMPPLSSALMIRVSRHIRTTGARRRYTRAMNMRVFDATTNDIEMAFHLD